MTNETWLIAEPRSVRTALVANASDTSADLAAGPSPITSVVVSTTGGSVRVQAHDRLDVELDVVSLSDRPLTAALTGDTFKVSYDFTGIEGIAHRVQTLKDRDTAEIVVRVPRTASVKVTTVRADVTVEDLSAPVTVTTGDGSVEILSVTGSVSVSTAAGRVSCDSLVGPVSVRTATGSVRLAGQLSRADVSTVSGEVSIETTPGASVVTTKSISSKIALRVPDETRVDLRVRSVTGKVSLDGADLRAAGPRTALLERAEPGATVFLTANTVSGDVIVSRQD